MTISTNLCALKSKALGVLVGAGMMVGVVNAADNAGTRPEFLTYDQPIVVFKSIDGGKYPFMMKFNPATSDIQTVLFGAYKNGSVQLIKKGEELATMIPVRSITQNIDSNIKLDKKFKGYRETVIGVGLESTLQILGLMSAAGYKGIPLVDEYVAGCPMKIVLSSQAHLDALVQYLSRCFAAKGIEPRDSKPLLLLNVLNQPTSNDSMAFLEEYFEILDSSDSAVKLFFEGAQKAIYGAMIKTKDARLVGESVGEVLMNTWEEGVSKIAKDFDTKKFALYALGGVGAYLAGDLIINPGTSKIKGFLNNQFMSQQKDKDGASVLKDGKPVYVLDTDKLKIPAATVAAILAGMVAYNALLGEKDESELNQIYTA